MTTYLEKTESPIENKDFEVLVNPMDFGIQLEDENVRLPIETIISEYDREYNEIISADGGVEIYAKAGALRKKLAKIRTEITRIHKSKKEYWLNGGRACDSWKNEKTELVQTKETKLFEIETTPQRLEQARIKTLTAERIEILKQYDFDGTTIPTIAVMSDDLWDIYLVGIKTTFQNKKEAERIAESERLTKQMLLDAERDKQIAENIKLKAEAELRDKQLADERKKQADILAKQKAESEAKQQAEAKKQAEILAKQKAESDAKLKIEREAKAKIEKELQDKKDAEAKLKADEEARIEAEANMGDKSKIQALINYLEEGKAKFQFKSKANQKKYDDICAFLDSAINHLKR